MALRDRTGFFACRAGRSDRTRHRSRTARLVACSAALILAVVPTSSRAQTYAIQSITTGNLGTVAASASGITVFRIRDDTVTTVFGNGTYISGTANSPVVTISCTDGTGAANSCANNSANVTVNRIGINSGRGQTFQDIGINGYPGITLSGTTYSTSGSMTFGVGGWTAAGDKQFYIAMHWPLLGDDSSLSVTASSQYSLAVAKSPTVPSGGTLSTVTATVRRALAIAKTSDLIFGSVVKPATGNFNIFISNTDGSRGTSPNSWQTNLIPSNYGPAVYTISGEPGTSFSLGYPSTFNMNGPATLLTNIVGTIPSGSQSIPAGGTTNLVLGGYINIASGQPSGSYSGSFVVTLAYN